MKNYWASWIPFIELESCHMGALIISSISFSGRSEQKFSVSLWTGGCKQMYYPLNTITFESLLVWRKKKQKRFAHFFIFGPEYEQSQVKGCKQMFVRLHPAAIDLTWVHQAPHLVMGKETDGNKCHKSNIHYVLLWFRRRYVYGSSVDQEQMLPMLKDP